MATREDFDRIGNYARMYNPDKNIDRLKLKRTVPLEVLCLGYSRTGTLSMSKAMEILNYSNPYHFSSFFDNVRECDLWNDALDAKFYGKGPLVDGGLEGEKGKQFFDGLLGHVGAVTDAPCNLFARELVGFYPEAKVVLVEREIESWMGSWMPFWITGFDPILYVLARFEPHWMKRVTSVGWKISSIQAGFANTIPEAKVRSRDAYRRHYMEVKEMVLEQKLLSFNLKEGWGPLCAFLGKPVPDVPFPHQNETQANKQAFKEIGAKSMKNIGMNIVTVMAVVGAPMMVLLPIILYWHRQ